MKNKNQWRIKSISAPPEDMPKDTKCPIGHLVSSAVHRTAKGGLTVLISVLIIYGVVQSGTITPPPGTPTAKFYTLSEIYNFITNNAAAAEGGHSFAFSDSLEGTGRTLTEIYNALAGLISADKVKLGTTYLNVAGALVPSGGDAAPADVFSGKTFFGASQTNWNVQTGALNLACNTVTFDGAGNLVLDAYDGGGNGTNRWCITDSGDAAAVDVLSGKIVWVDGQAITGSMTNVGAQTITPSTSNQTITAGYHNGSGYCAGDTDLLPANIKSGAFDIFGVSGTLLTNPLYGGNDPTKVLNTAANPGTYDVATCTTNYNTLNLSVGTVKSGTAFGDGLIGDYPSASYSLPGDTAAIDATSTDMKTGLEAWTKAGVLITGSGTQTLSSANDTVSAGYYSATTLSAIDTDLISNNILSGKIIFGVSGKTEVVDTTEAAVPIAADTVLANKVGFVNGSKITGAMADKEGDNGSTAQSAAAGVNYFTAPAGFYDGDDRVSATDAQIAALDTDIAPGNIKSDATIFGIGGNGNVVDTSAGTVTDNAQIRSNYVCFSDGAQYTGSIADCADGDSNCYAASGKRYANECSDSTTGTQTACYLDDTAKYVDNNACSALSNDGYCFMDTSTFSAKDADLAEGNIANNVNIFGVSGTLLKNLKNGSATSGATDYAFWTQTLGGVDDYNDGAAQPMPTGSYVGTWTDCTSGADNYCGLGATDTNADAKDNSTGLIWSNWLDSGNYHTWFWANNCYEPADQTPAGVCAADGDDGCQCQKKSSKVGCEALGDGGWRLPYQKELMQAYINGSSKSSVSYLSSAAYAYWSAATRSDTTYHAWYTGLTAGSTYSSAKTNSTAIRVRCVR